MTPTLAAYIAANFEVVSSINTSDNPLLGSGFDATVWRIKAGSDLAGPGNADAGKIYISMRGTEPGAGGADFVTDGDLALGSAATLAILDMVNWWLRISTPEGVNNARQVEYESIYDNSTPPVKIGTRLVDAPNVSGLGLVSATELARGVQIDGHSMGGHMASAFARIFGANSGVGGSVNVQAIATYNSAGFNGDNAETMFQAMQTLLGTGVSSFAPVIAKQTNYFAANGVNVTTNDWWFTQMGTRQGLYQEETLGLGNHSMYRMTDLLVLGAALEKLDSTFTIDKLNALSKAGSNDPKASLEGVLDSLRKALAGPNVEPLPIGDAADSDPSRVTYHATLEALQANQIFKDVAGKLIIKPVGSAADLRAAARNNFGALITLQDLSSFSIGGINSAADAQLQTLWQASRAGDYSAWTADKTSATPSTFTDQWITDRAAMLGIVVHRNQGDLTGALTPTPTLGIDAGHYLDVTSHTDITVGADISTTREFYFGGDAADSFVGRSADDHLYGGAGGDNLSGQGGADYLEGNAGNDTLNGGAGDDALVGGEGADLVQGGVGLDTYTAGHGDTLKDSDGKGAVLLNGVALSGGHKDGGGVYVGGDGTRYVLAGNNRTEGCTGQRLGWHRDHGDTVPLALPPCARMPKRPLRAIC